MLLFIFYLKDQSGHDVPIFPSILPRPNLGFFMIDMLQLKIICWEDRCLVLDADQVYIFFPHMLYFLYMPSVTYLLVHDFSWALSSTTASTDPYGGNCVTWNVLAGPIYSDTLDEVPFHSYWWDALIFWFVGLLCWAPSHFLKIQSPTYCKLICLWKNPGAGGVQTNSCWERKFPERTLYRLS